MLFLDFIKISKKINFSTQVTTLRLKTYYIRKTYLKNILT
ncbi:hypothetical protein G436_2482 [Leptospira interrogans serovar Hardjo str. Norma]|uniref:Uncharacterized protein n=1 Tax=Leptospira interrogans serovar Hardjo str. Norma TaxID=1279460 RepID=A0A0M4N637_LEPIR|nr:hypothetical protein G436_2482 [Leptospira interrogans serovar Hardjo str. Norma]